MSIIPLNRSEKLEILYGVSDTEFGLCLIAWIDQGICFLAYGNKHNIDGAISDMKELWNKSKFIEDSSGASKLVNFIFKENYKSDLIATGTDFQIRVWNELMNIPPGTSISYEALAKRLGGKNYTRATASAIARNNISYLIPCHRVIRKSGNINKYRWGIDIKSRLLEWENAKAN